MRPGDIERLVLPKTLKESVGKPQGITEGELAESIKKAELNPFYQYLIREGIYADYSQALGGLHDKVVEAAVPALIGRELLTVLPVTKDPVRFPKALHGKAWHTGEAETPVTPEMYGNVDVSAGELKSRAEWSETFFEDAEWNVVERFIKESGRAVGQLETEDVIAMYVTLAATVAQIASGAKIGWTAAGPTWAQFCAMITAVRNEGFEPKVIAMNWTQYGLLMALPQFTQSLYYAPETAMRTGVIDTTLGVKVVASSLMTDVVCVDTDYVVMTVRREMNTKPYENPAKQMYGALANERIGMQVLRLAAKGGRAVAVATPA